LIGGGGVTRFQQVSYAVGLLALGSSQLWFGHIENYSLVTAATFVTIVLAIGYLQERVKLPWVGLVAGAAVSFHPQALFAMPALLFLCKKPYWLHQLFILSDSALVILLFTVALLWLAGAPLPHSGWGFTKVKLRQDPIFRYLSVVTMGLLFYHFSFQKGRQSASHGVGTGSVDECCVTPCNALWPALVFSALFTAAWVGVNHLWTCVPMLVNR
jgi:hypothetical protein